MRSILKHVLKCILPVFFLVGMTGCIPVFLDPNPVHVELLGNNFTYNALRPAPYWTVYWRGNGSLLSFTAVIRSTSERALEFANVSFTVGVASKGFMLQTYPNIRINQPFTVTVYPTENANTAQQLLLISANSDNGSQYGFSEDIEVIRR